jgi:hypothetical protein
MNIKRLYIIIVGVLLTGSIIIGQERENKPVGLQASLFTGYNGGFGIQANLMLIDIAADFPFNIRIGAGYSVFNPGIAADARRIFINNATNGVPEKGGSAFDYRLDMLLKRSIFGVSQSYLILGPRYSSFKGNFKYIGGNEDFDVTSKQWGIGTGFENHFSVSDRVEIVFSAGLDYYFPNTLKGHDTSYSPDNDNINPRDDNQNGDIEFVYKDSDKAINQPKFVPRAMIGLSFKL